MRVQNKLLIATKSMLCMHMPLFITEANCVSWKSSQLNISYKLNKEKRINISYPFSFIKIISSDVGLRFCSAHKLLWASHKDRKRAPRLLRPHRINKIFNVTTVLFSFYDINVSSNTQWANKFLSTGPKFTWLLTQLFKSHVPRNKEYLQCRLH
jgi:hypothetical protein